LGCIKNGTGVCVGGEAGLTSDGGDGSRYSVVSTLSPTCGLGANERMLTGGIDDASGTDEWRPDLPGRESCGAAAPATTGWPDASVGAEKSESIATADGDGGVSG